MVKKQKKQKVEFYKKMISENKVEALFKLLDISLSNSSNVYNYLVQLKSRYTQLEETRMLDLISDSAYSLETNKLKNGILSFLDTLEEEDFVNSLVPFKDESDAVKKLKSSQEKEDKFFLDSLKLHGLKRELYSDEGMSIFNNSFEELSTQVIEVGERYAEIAKYKLLKKQKDSKFVVVEVGQLLIKVVACTDKTKRYVWIDISSQNGKKIQNEKLSLDSFQLDYSKDFKPIWKSNHDESIVMTSKEVALMIMKSVFSSLMVQNPPPNLVIPKKINLS